MHLVDVRLTCLLNITYFLTYIFTYFVSKINFNTPSDRIWNMLHKIQGNDISQPVRHLKVNNNSITCLQSKIIQVEDNDKNKMISNSKLDAQCVEMQIHADSKGKVALGDKTLWPTVV